MCADANALLTLDEFQRFVVAVDVSSDDETGLKRAMAAVRGCQRTLDGLVTRIGIRADELAAAGESAPADETCRGSGTVGSAQAKREAGRAKAAAVTPALGDAISAGEVTGEHVDVIARHTKDLTSEQVEQLDVSGLIEKAKTMPVETFARLVSRAVDNIKNDHGLADADKKRSASEFRHWFDETSGMGRFSGQLDPEWYEAFTTAIEQHKRTLAAGSDGTVTLDRHLGARALVELVVGAGELNSRLPSITVIVDHDTLVRGGHERSVRQTQDGHDLPPETVARLCCDAVIETVFRDERGRPVNVGMKHRTATGAQWTAIKAIYKSCAWGGCRAPISWCQLHHIHEWAKGGRTDLCNLVPLCSNHHHRVHEGRWSIKLLTDRSLDIYKPGGQHHTTVPPPQRDLSRC